LVAQNKSPQKLYFTILHFSSDYGIYLIQQESTPVTSRPLIFLDALFLPDNGTEILYFKLNLFLQDNIQKKEILPIRNRPDALVPDDWTCKTIVVKVSK